MRSAAISNSAPIDLAALAVRLRRLAEAAAAEHAAVAGPREVLNAPLRRVHAAHSSSATSSRDQAHRLRLLAQGEEGGA